MMLILWCCEHYLVDAFLKLYKYLMPDRPTSPPFSTISSLRLYRSVCGVANISYFIKPSKHSDKPNCVLFSLWILEACLITRTVYQKYWSNFFKPEVRFKKLLISSASNVNIADFFQLKYDIKDNNIFFVLKVLLNDNPSIS